MTKQSFITFSCDSTPCSNSTVGGGEDSFLMAPDGWITVNLDDPIIEDGTRHFCSPSCLADWAVEQAHLRRP